MSGENTLSLDFYKYLCQKIGSEDEVKVRRLTYIIDDLGNISGTKITSGSKGEGLQLKGSDLDLMFIDPLFKVYEPESDFVPQSCTCINLLMKTEDTHPCFTHLHHVNNHDLTVNPGKRIKKSFLGRKFSSELYRLNRMELMHSVDGITKIHGPCISTTTENVDLAWCLKCDKWVSQANQWVIRPRTTWPPLDLISKIISCGVLFVPIGYKGSSNEHLQWRISFSVAEKFLIFSYNHTQLLCYALLKILIKEIVEKHEDLKSLLCSYFMKTLMFWISEESDPSMWRPDTIIQCFMACLKRLIYCVEYSTLLHYFIPDYNLFYLRFDADKKFKMTSTLKNLYDKGIYCFTQSETLYNFMGLPLNAKDSSIGRRVASLHGMMSSVFKYERRPLNLLHHFYHHSGSKISKGIFFGMLSFAYQSAPQKSQNQPRSNNKNKYYKCKRDRSNLLIGTNSDAVSGWMVLASFFYVHGNYLLSLDIINHALRKCTSEKIYPWKVCLNQNQEYLLYLLKQRALCTILKTITVRCPRFHQNSPISAQELQLNEFERVLNLHPMIFAHFLRFLCYYHLHEPRSCKQSLLLLQQITMQLLTTYRSLTFHDTLSFICLGIAHQMIGDKYSARQNFLQATQMDEYNVTSAAMRLANFNVD